jgi:hypothetical protein
VFGIAYLHPSGIDLVGLSASFPTADSARAALSAFRASLGLEPTYIPERCVVLEMPDPIPIRFQIVFHDGHSKSTWEGIPSDGKRYWHSEKAARTALSRLIQKLTLEHGTVDTQNFEVEKIQWNTTSGRRPPRGRYGRRVPWKLRMVEDGERVYIRQYQAMTTRNAARSYGLSWIDLCCKFCCKISATENWKYPGAGLKSCELLVDLCSKRRKY